MSKDMGEPCALQEAIVEDTITMAADMQEDEVTSDSHFQKMRVPLIHCLDMVQRIISKPMKPRHRDPVGKRL